jgi:hypothetical protein
VKALGERVAPGHDGQRDQDLDLVLIDALEHPVGDPPDDQAEEEPAQCLLEKQHRGPTHRDLAFAAGHADEQEEDDEPDTVVEERLAGDLGLQRIRDPGTLQDRQHRNRVGGRDQRAEDQAGQERQPDAERVEHQPRGASDQRRREQDAHSRQQRDDPPLRGEVVQVDVERPREQQRTEHAVQQRPTEIELGY